jgi:hypothetical protein
MGLFLANGTRRIKSALVTTTVADPEVVINEDLYETKRYTDQDPKPEGSILTLKYRAGKVVRQSYIDSILFPPATADSRVPAGNLPATNTTTVVTVTGTNLDGVVSGTIGGTAVTALVVDKPTQLHFTIPSKAAGTYDLVLVDDAGTLTATGFCTFA